ncbi:MAG TPA: amidohydrolase family protein [Dehalococcoidia bacterium]|nr:amidohydrolase family protein [Dehalococcoidia bacterium]
MPPFDEIPLIDNHVHPPFMAEAAAARPFLSYFSEADGEELIERHVPHSRFFRRALRELAELLDCEATAEAVQAARTALGPETLLRRCVEAGNIAAFVVDDGYPPPDQALSVADIAQAAGCAAARVLRLESLVASVATEHGGINGFDAALLAGLEQARRQGTKALKSIIAYRCGLAFSVPERETARAGLVEVHLRCRAGDARVTDARLLYHALALALDFAGEHGLPVQIHTGYGDRDLDLLGANPALLRGLLENPRFARVPVVLLHASYPYSRAASYLAAMYANVFVDFSEANPMLPAAELARVIDELLGLAPPTKVLYGSDAWGIPDWLYLGARHGRLALAAALDGDPDAAVIARRVLYDNAAELYGFRER